MLSLQILDKLLIFFHDLPEFWLSNVDSFQIFGKLIISFIALLEFWLSNADKFPDLW